ncbi:MAG: class I SAM-dependent methyltransferase [Roseiflexaceae bacterium]|jgi:SAM-dependent methyltransferase
MNDPVAGIDWLALWRDMYERERAQGDAATHPDMERSADHYATAAARFARNAKRVPQPDAVMRWLLPQLSHGDTVLDIGAGSGRYLPPLVAAGCRVVALERSPAMVEQMHLLVAEQQLTDVTIMREYWPPPEPLVGDVALAVHVLYALPDIAPFVQAMQGAARKLCVLVLGVRHPTTPVLPLWHAYHGTPRLPLPGAYECLNALAQLGIHANLSMLSVGQPIQYTSLAEAVAETCFRLRLPYDDVHQHRIATLIQTHWHISDAGEVIVPGAPPRNAVIWWHPHVS